MEYEGLAQHISREVQGLLNHLNPNHNRNQQRNYITHHINSWIHQALRDWEVKQNTVNNTVDNREELVTAMYEQAFEEDKAYAYGEYHMDSLSQLTDEEFTAKWREYKGG